MADTPDIDIEEIQKDFDALGGSTICIGEWLSDPSKEVDGDGSFDRVMNNLFSKLEDQATLQRMSGTEIAQVYSATLTTGIQASMQWTLSRCKTLAEIRLMNANAVKAIFDAKKAEVDWRISEAILRRTEAEVELTHQKVFTERAQTDGSVIQPGSILDKQRMILTRQADGFLRDAEQKATNVIWDVYKTLISVGEDFSPGQSGATFANMHTFLRLLGTGVGVTIPDADPPPP